MSSHSERVNDLIREHSSLSKSGGSRTEQDAPNARVKEIRQELVSILHSGPEK